MMQHMVRKPISYHVYEGYIDSHIVISDRITIIETQACILNINN